MSELVIRGAQIVDRSGDAPFDGDVATKDGVISALGRVEGEGREGIDARDLLVTPGFVDIHWTRVGLALLSALFPALGCARLGVDQAGARQPLRLRSARLGQCLPDPDRRGKRHLQ